MPLTTGAHQSPIDIVVSDVKVDPGLAEFEVRYPTIPVPVEVCLIAADGDDTSDGPIVIPQVVVTPRESGAHVTLGGDRFDLVSFHWHTPSEHRIDGFQFPLVLHLVHQATDGTFLVLGVLSESGRHDEAIEPAFALIPDLDTTAPGAGRRECRPAHMTLVDLVPARTGTYRYSGSLTTAPFTEGLHWIICTTTRTASEEQIGAYMTLVSTPMEGFGHRPQPPGNARRIQERADRIVVTEARIEAGVQVAGAS